MRRWGVLGLTALAAAAFVTRVSARGSDVGVLVRTTKPIAAFAQNEELNELVENPTKDDRP